MFSANSSQVSNDANYIEDVFSTYLYTGNGSTQTINNGIDLAGKGGLVWLKYRSGGGNPAGHFLYTPDLPGSGGGYAYKHLQTNNANAAGEGFNALNTFNSNGFSLGGNSEINYSGDTYASWTFRKQPKFFDVVTYTGNGAVRTLAHNLGSVPGCVLIKCTSLGGTDWMVFHRSASTGYLYLNDTAALMTAGAATFFGNGTSVVAPDATSIYLGSGDGQINQTSATYVAYVFAHNAGGFGASGTDNVISCGSYTGDGAAGGQLINLGYEVQWVMIKNVTSGGDWWLTDVMRGFTVNGDYGGDANLSPNSSGAESQQVLGQPDARGFRPIQDNVNASGQTYIYIAIRRGPMKVPTNGTSVFAIDTRHNTTPAFVSNFPVDMSTYRAKSGSDWYIQSRLTPNYLFTNSTAAEAAGQLFSATQFASNTGWGNSGADIPDLFSYMFRRAPSTFDVVCYTGTGSTTSYNHNLGVAPELMIIKSRNDANDWAVYSSALGNTKNLRLNTTAAASTALNLWASTTPSATTFTTNGTYNLVGGGTITYVAYLFATCAGVQYINSYVGDGTTGRTINCGFAGGARFVCIKATSTSGSWWTFDSARGIVTNSDPALQLNSTAAEVTSADAIDTAASGFIVNQEATCSLNASGVSYLVWAIA